MTMNRESKHNSYLKIGVNGLLIVCGGIFFYYILFHSDKLSALIRAVLSIFRPIISGLVIAYILNPIMRFLENKVSYPIWNRIKPKKDHVYSKEKIVIRAICATITLVLFIALIYGLIITVVPQLVTNIQSVLSRIPVYLLNINDYYSNILIKYPNLESMLTQYRYVQTVL